jgi:hypothetical protein
MTELANLQLLINDMATGMIKMERISIASTIIRETDGLDPDKTRAVLNAIITLLESIELKKH